MWEAWVGKDCERPMKGDVTEDDGDAASEKGFGTSGGSGSGSGSGSGWDSVLPISATYLNPPNARLILAPSGGRHRAILPWRHRVYTPSSPATPAVPSSSVLNLPQATITSPPPPRPLPIPIPVPILSSSAASLSLSSPTPVLLPPSDPATPPNPALRLTVLIAMPSPPSSRHTRDDEDEGPPVVEFGVVDVDVRSGSGPSRASSDRGGEGEDSVGREK